MDRFLSSLKKWLKSSRIEQGDLAAEWDENIKNLSAYVTGRLRMPDHLRTKFTMLGYQGPWPKEELEEWKAGPGEQFAMMSLNEPEATYVTGALPEHIQEAYKIVREALDAAKADISTMDQNQVGLVIGLAAEEIAKGNRAEARQTLLRRAEVLLGLKAP